MRSSGNRSQVLLSGDRGDAEGGGEARRLWPHSASSPRRCGRSFNLQPQQQLASSWNVRFILYTAQITTSKMNERQFMPQLELANQSTVCSTHSGS
jgi:hypothetical protein